MVVWTALTYRFGLYLGTDKGMWRGGWHTCQAADCCKMYCILLQDVGVRTMIDGAGWRGWNRVEESRSLLGMGGKQGLSEGMAGASDTSWISPS